MRPTTSATAPARRSDRSSAASTALPCTGWRRGRVGAPAVAAEHGGRYEMGPTEPSATTAHPVAGAGPRPTPGDHGRPPVLDEVPELAALLDDVEAADRAQRSAVARLADLLTTDQIVSRTGVDVEHWLAAVARQTRMDRRLLRRACRLLHRLPRLDRAVRDGEVSFAQLRGITLALRGVPRELDPSLDDVLATLLAALADLDRPDPDVLVRQLADAADELDGDRLARAEQDAHDRRHLWLQPHLDGGGGRFGGELDAAGMALLELATAPPDDLRSLPGGMGAARAEVLLARLAGAGTAGGPGEDTTPADDGSASSGDDARAPVGDGTWRDHLAAPRLLVRLPFEALCDPRVPADLLTGLVGGRLRLTSAAARDLVERRGALLRVVVVDDDGAVLGVGRASRRPPGWVRDAVAALHDTCTGPGCDRPAGRADLDHAQPWWPTSSTESPGRTDIDQLGPLCPATNREKEAAGWKVRQTAAGVRTWRHPRSGLTTTTVPSSWRPPGDPRRRPRPRTDATTSEADAGPDHPALPPDLPF